MRGTNGQTNVRDPGGTARGVPSYAPRRPTPIFASEVAWAEPGQTGTRAAAERSLLPFSPRATERRLSRGAVPAGSMYCRASMVCALESVCRGSAGRNSC